MVKMAKVDWSFSPFVRQYIIVTLVNLSVLGIGLGLAWTSPVLVKLTDKTNPVFAQPVTDEQGTWIVSVSFISEALTNCLTVLVVDRFGRKYCMIYTAIPRILSSVFLVFADAVWMVIVGRVLMGMADGFSFTVVPMYASEIASKEIRGSLGTFFQIFSSIGIVLMLCIGPFIDYYTLNIIMLCIVSATSIPLLFLPDSPSSLHVKGQTEDALKVLTYLRGSVEAANEELKEYSQGKDGEKTKLKAIFESKTVLKTLALTIFICAGAQLTGCNAVTYYLQTVLESTKTSVSSNTASVVIGVIQLVASVVTAFIIDKFGRKPILAVSLVGITVGMVGLGSFFYIVQNGSEVVGFLNYLPLISFIFIVYSFGSGFGSILLPLVSELFDNNTRAVGMYCAQISCLLFIFITTKFFTPFTNLIGPAAVYYIFAVNSVLLLIYILRMAPETKGKSFAEIQESFQMAEDDVENKS